MGVEALQSFLENECKDANVPVDMAKLIKVASETPEGAVGASGGGKISLIIDAECCLDRLYGGLHADWYSGGQWNRMYEFLSALNTACAKTGVKLVVFTSGALEKSRLKQWAAQQVETKRKIETAVRQVHTRGGPPAGALWTPPACLRHVLRLALRHIGVAVSCSMDDHRQEVISYCRENKFDGLLVRDAEYIIFAAAAAPPRLFSANLFKLSFKKEISTTEYLLDNVAKSLNLHPDRFPLLGALLGNHILTVDDLKAFHKALLDGADPNSARPKSVVEKVANFVRRLPQADDWQAIAKVAFNNVTDMKKLSALIQRLKDSTQYYVNGTAKGYLQFREGAAGCASDGFAPSGLETAPPADDSNEAFASDTDKEKKTLDLGLGDMKLVEEATDARKKILQLTLSRHQRGLMHPWVNHVIANKEVKIQAVMEDSSTDDVPSSLDVYRELRQKIYGVLLDARERTSSLHVDADEPDLVVKEWYVSRGNAADRADYVPARALDWDVPSVEKLWFGDGAEDKATRLKAFLSIMGVEVEEFDRSTPLLDVNKVPRKYLMLCATLRYLLRYSSEKRGFLSRVELDAILATAVSPIIKNVSLTKEMKLPKVHPRAMVVAALFMQGIEVASFANDACGSPVPWQFTCPWEFFDGKIFHLKMVMASSNRSLLDICDGQTAQLLQVERMREAILAAPGLALSRPRLLMPAASPMMMPDGASSRGGAPSMGLGPGAPRNNNVRGSNVGSAGLGRGFHREMASANPGMLMMGAPNQQRQPQQQSFSSSFQQREQQWSAGGRVGMPQMSRQEAIQHEANAYTNYHIGRKQPIY